ncbi:uncharacterized protein METZ01_LOCUS492129, partial [marine metagenome]
GPYRCRRGRRGGGRGRGQGPDSTPATRRSRRAAGRRAPLSSLLPVGPGRHGGRDRRMWALRGTHLL